MDAPERLPWLALTLAQVTAVAGVGVLAWLAARRGGPALRAAVVLAALVALLVVPALAAVAPVWVPIPVSPRPVAYRPVPPESPVLPSPPPAPRVVALAPAVSPARVPLEADDSDDPFADFDLPEEEATEPVAAAPAEPAAAALSVETRREPPSVVGFLTVVWLGGALACLAGSAFRLGLLYRWARRAELIPEREWADSLSAGRGGRPAVALRESREIGSPLTLGLVRPVVLLPAGWRGWSDEQLGMVLAHELAHVRRRDFLAGLVAELAVCLCWFHPLVRWLAGRLRLEQEYAADAWAASAAGDAMTYVRCLARLALEQGAGRGSPAPALWRRRPEILRRIDMLRRNRDGRPPAVGRWAAGAVVGLAAAGCVAVAGVGPRGPAGDEPKAADTAPAAKAPAADPGGDPLPAGALARLGTTRWRHGSNISYVAFGAEGKTVVTAGMDNTVRLWDAATGKEIRRFALPKLAEARPGAGRPQGATAAPAPQIGLDAARAAVEKTTAAAAKARREAAAETDGGKAEAAKAQAEKAAAAAEKAQAELRKKLAEVEAAVRQQRAMFVGAAGGPLAAVTPDGKTLAVANPAGVLLYRVESGDELRKIDRPPAGLVGLLFSPDGKTLAGRGGDGGMTLWDAGTGEVRQRLAASAPPATRQVQVMVLRAGGNTAPGMAFSQDGKTLAVATTEYKDEAVVGSVKFWDVAKGTQLREIKAPEGAFVAGVAYAPKGKVMAYCVGTAVHLCDADSGKELRQITVPEPAQSVTFSPDGKTVVTHGRNQQSRAWVTDTGKELYQLADAPPQARPIAGGFALAGSFPTAPEVRNLAFSPDGSRIASATGGTIHLWSAAAGKEQSPPDGHQGPVTAVALSADGRTVVSWGTDRTIRRWDAATGKPLGSFRPPAGTATATLAPDGRMIAIAATDNSVRLLETTGGKELHRFQSNNRGAAALAFSPDGKVLAERGADNVVRLYDTAKGVETRQIALAGGGQLYPGVVVASPAGMFAGGAPAGLVFSPDGKLLAVPGVASPLPGTRGGRMVITLYDVTTGKVVRPVELTGTIVGFAFSPDGRVLATENADESVSLMEVASGKERARLGKAPAPTAAPVPVPPVPAAAARVTAIGPASADSPAAGIAFSPDGRVLVARGPDRAVRAWDVTSGGEAGRVAGHDGRVGTIAVSADGRVVATGSADTTVLLWDAAALRKALPAPEAGELADAAANAAWADLAAEDPGNALRAVLKLAAAPDPAARFLGGKLKPAAPIDPQKLEKWVADLESVRFAVRQEASTNLVKAGEQVVPALQKVLVSQPTIETRQRVETLLDRLAGGTLSSEQLRVVRATEALERMGTPAARELLRALSDGAAGALSTREARAALDRLAK